MNISVRLANGALSWSTNTDIRLPSPLCTYGTLAQELGVRLSRGRAQYIHNGHRFDITLFPGKTALEIVRAVGKILVHALRNQNAAIEGNFHLVRPGESHLLPIEASVEVSGGKLQLGNRIYDLVASPDTDGSALIEHTVAAANEQLQQYQQVYNLAVSNAQTEIDRRVHDLEVQYQNSVVIPQLTYDDVIRRGLRVYVDRGSLVWLLPFLYEPKYVVNHFRSENVASARRHIRQDLQDMIRKVVILMVSTYDNKLRNLRLVCPDDVTCNFQHYHTGCFGTWQAPDRSLVLPQDLFSIRDQLQRELEIVNAASIATEEPFDMPNIAEIERTDQPATETVSQGEQLLEIVPRRGAARPPQRASETVGWTIP